MRQKYTFQGAFARGENDDPFRYIAFHVPAGTRRLEVSYHFDRSEDQPSGVGAATDVVDIGVFDSRGVDFLQGGFRGWSGGARSGFFITPEEATPGYIRGPLVEGEWNLVLGGRVNHSESCPYTVQVSLDVDPEGGDPGPLPELAPRAESLKQPGEARWYRGDFHSHTVHSDGHNTIDEYAVEASRVGLDFLAITDHNTVSHFEEIAERPPGDVLLIPGEEVTTFWGHANVWGVGGWVDFRATDDESMHRVMEWVHERGGLFSPNHPKVSAGYPWEFDGVRDYRIVEAWQGAWRFHNTESLAFWEERLNAGARVVAVGGSDCHSIPPAVFIHPWTVGTPCTWVFAQGPDEAAILDGVRAGHVFLSEDTTGPFLELTASCEGGSFMTGDAIDAKPGSTVRFGLRYRGPAEKKLRLLRNGQVWQQVVAEREDVTVEFDLTLDEPGYVRADVIGFRGRPERGEVVHAMTNPIYLAPKHG